MILKRILAGLLLVPLLFVYPTVLFASSPFTGTDNLDCVLFTGDKGTYSGARDAATGDSEELGALETQNAVFAGLYYVRRPCIRFDTNIAAPGAVVSSAVFHFRPTSKIDADSDSVVLVSFGPFDTTNPGVADFDQYGSTALSGTMTLAAVTTGADNTLSLNATGIAALNLTGNTWFGLRSVNDINNVTPTGNGQVVFDSAGEANPPTLVITYSVSSGGTTTTITKIITIM